MKKYRYRIAYFTTDWNYELVETTLHGLQDYVRDHDDTQICVFDCFGKDTDTPLIRAEYDIFALPDLRGFDGVLVQGNQIVLGRVRKKIEARIQELGIPAVCMDCPMEGTTLIGVENQEAQRCVARHIFQVHGIKRVAYLTGIMENDCPEGHQRLNGFLEAAQEAGIHEDNIRIFYGRWRVEDGYQCGEMLLSGPEPLPQAVICANDDMALGLIECLQERGIRIPEDIIVSGFDGNTSSELSSPQLCTIHRDYRSMIYGVMESLTKAIQGENLKKEIFYDYEPVFTESCGCQSSLKGKDVRRRFFDQTRYLRSFYTLQESMAERLLSADSLPQLMDALEEYHHVLGTDDLYLCMNASYFDYFYSRNRKNGPTAFSDQMYLMTCKSMAGTADENHIYARFDRKLLLSAPILEKEQLMIFYPLHYNLDSIGYIVLNGISKTAKLNLHESIFSFLAVAIENIRQRTLLEQLNDVLDDLYVHDSLTGLYNRFGYERFAPALFDEILAGGETAWVLFVDMDDMKTINDRFGHETGDQAIQASAQILKSAIREGDFLMRYGGDEFMALGRGLGETLGERISHALTLSEEANHFPFRLNLSVGICQAFPGQGKTLDQCLQEADKTMYQIKASKKEGKKGG